MEDNNQRDDDEPVLNFKEISTTKLGENNVKYSPDPCTILGNGLTAIVYPGYHFGIKKPAAVKFIKTQYLRVENDEVNELKIWCKVDQNINIVRLYDSYRDPRNGLFLAMEKADRTFRAQITNCNPTGYDVITWLYQVTNAVEYLHGKGVIHRDIKPDNILMFLQDGNKTVAKLADFGVSKMISSVERTGTFSMANGTLLWMAPEALENKTRKFKNTKMLDIFALGMTIYFGLSGGGHPFSFSEDDDTIVTSLFTKMTASYIVPNQLSKDQHAANDLLKDMMQREPSNRPKISDVLSHCLFWNWAKQHQFLIRFAICLSNRNCSQIYWIKKQIDFMYNQFYSEVFSGKKFNWITMGSEDGINIQELNSTSRAPARHYRTQAYGNGDSVTKFLKFFRDKYVHHPEINPYGALVFSDNDGIFCEEMYLSVLTSTCPGLVLTLYKYLSLNIHVVSLLPMSIIYFPSRVHTIGDGNYEVRELARENQFQTYERPVFESENDSNNIGSAVGSSEDNRNEESLLNQGNYNGDYLNEENFGPEYEYSSSNSN